jgi:hypothetical protein
MGFAGPLVGHRGTVALQHGPGCPARQPHEVGLAAAPAEPAVGVEVIDAGLPAPAAEEPGDAGVGDAALAADPAPRQFGVWMASAGAVAVRGRGRLPAGQQPGEEGLQVLTGGGGQVEAAGREKASRWRTASR